MFSDYTFRRTHIHTHRHIQITHPGAHTHTHTHTHTRTQAHTCARLHRHGGANTHAPARRVAHTQTCTRTGAFTHAHKRITHARTQTQRACTRMHNTHACAHAYMRTHIHVEKHPNKMSVRLFSSLHCSLICNMS